MKKKVAFALGGGGACGIAHIGFFRALEEKSIVPDIVCGTSMGALVGACYAAGVPLDEIEKRALSLTLFEIIDLDPIFYRSGGFLRGKKVENILSELLPITTFDEVKMPFGCMAVNLGNGELTALKEGNLIDSLRATSAIPGAFKPVKIGDDLFIDGGVLERIPCNLCYEMGADIVIGVNVIEKLRGEFKPRNMFDVIARTYAITDEKILKLSALKCDLMLDISLCGVDPYNVKNVGRSLTEGYNVTMTHMNEILDLINES